MSKRIQLGLGVLTLLLAMVALIALPPAPVRAQLSGSQGFAYTHISTATNTVIATAPVEVIVAVNGGTTGAVTLYDNTTCTGTVFGVIQAATAPVVMPYLMQTKAGLCVTTAAATDLTVGVK